MKYILISILIIILIVLISKNKEKFAIFYNKDNNDDKEKSYEVAVNLPNKLKYSLLTNDIINEFKKIESGPTSVSAKKDEKIEQIKKSIEKSSETQLKDAIKLNLQNDTEFKKSIKGNQGKRGESGISNEYTDVIAKNLKINNETLNRDHVNYINDYHNGLNSLYSNIIDVRKDKIAIDASLNDALYTDKLTLGDLDENISIRNEMDAIQIDKLNADLLNINNNNIYSDSNNKINMDKLKVDNLNVQDGLTIDGKPIFDLLKGSTGIKGDQGEKSSQKWIKIHGRKLKSPQIDIVGTINRLTGPQGYRGDKGDTGVTGDAFKLPTKITHNNDTITFETDGLPSFNVTGAKGNKGPEGAQGNEGRIGDHCAYPINVTKNGNTLTFVFDDPKYNKKINLQLDDFKGDQGLQGVKGIDGVNIYNDSLKFDNSKIEFTKNITFNDTNLKFDNTDLNTSEFEQNNIYIFTLARYLNISTQYKITDFDFSEEKNEALQSKIKEKIKEKINTKINNLLGKNINIYDFFYHELNIENNNYTLKQIIDIAKILDIEINDKIQPNIVTKIKNKCANFTKETTFKKMVEDIENNKEFIYIYKSFGNKLYFNEEKLSIKEMQIGFDNMEYNTIEKIKNNLNVIYEIVSEGNKYKDNKFLYKLVNNVYLAKTKTEFMNEIDNELQIFDFSDKYTFTLLEKLLILNNLKLSHGMDCKQVNKCKKYCQKHSINNNNVKYEASNDTYKCQNIYHETKRRDSLDKTREYIYIASKKDYTSEKPLFTSLDNLTDHSILEINANKHNILEDKFVLDHKSGLVFEMKEVDNKLQFNDLTSNVLDDNYLKYWDLNNNYLETDIRKYKLSLITKNFTHIFIIKFDEIPNNNEFLNFSFLDENNNITPKTTQKPIFLKDGKFHFINDKDPPQPTEYKERSSDPREIPSINPGEWYFIAISCKYNTLPIYSNKDTYNNLHLYMRSLESDEKPSIPIYMTLANSDGSNSNPITDLNMDFNGDEPFTDKNILYHIIGSKNNGLGKLSMFFSFNKHIRERRLNEIYNKIKKDYFIQESF
jgi:hypothetical protein